MWGKNGRGCQSKATENSMHGNMRGQQGTHKTQKWGGGRCLTCGKKTREGGGGVPCKQQEGGLSEGCFEKLFGGVVAGVGV